jgi:hypothetical protein
MTAPTKLDDLLHRWLEITEKETEAIRHGDWDSVARHQQQKRYLQAEISRTTDLGGLLPPRLRALVGRLKFLERRNAELIGERRRLALSRRAELDCSLRNLRRLGRSYAAAAVACWQSYS